MSPHRRPNMRTSMTARYFSATGMPVCLGDVTKIELELAEAPDDAILVGSVPSELDLTVEINSTYPHGIPEPGTVVVRAEEALIVALVLVLWVAAIALFFNRWGKIRMLEPYQPKFQQQHRQSYAVIEQNPIQNCSHSKFNVHCMDHRDSISGLTRPRQNSVFVSSSTSLLPGSQETPRRTKSAFDLQSLVLAECVVQDDVDQQTTYYDQDASRIVRPPSSKSGQQDRRRSVCQFDRNELVKPLLRERGVSICQFDRHDINGRTPKERGMSFCHFDRTDVLARPLQRDRVGSIYQFDRTDVLARPLQRDRGYSTYQFDRMEVLARPNPCLGKSLLRERRVSVCNFLEKDEEGNRGYQMNRRPSSCNVVQIETENETECTEKLNVFTKCSPREKRNVVCQLSDRPSCSKTPDVVLGYKATCV